MSQKIQRIIKRLAEENKTISTMESCTGGAISNAITNVEGASDVFLFSAITYSNEYKIKMGVNEDVINKYTVYSKNTANEMSKAISYFTNSTYGVGITGKLNRIDKNNPYGKDNLVFISVYDKEKDTYYNKEVLAIKNTRIKNKQLVINEVLEIISSIL